jgi:hypothetical protein
MWTINRVTLTNLLSHKDSTLVIPARQATLIYGINDTDKGQESNGSGKSVALEGITVGLIGESQRKISSKKLVNWDGTDHCDIKLDMTNSISNENVIITRTIFNNTKSSEIDIQLNGAPLNEIARNGANKLDVRQANAWILDRLQISKEDLMNYFLVSKKRFKSFFDQGDVAKKQVIGRFSQSNLVDGVFDIISEEIAILEQAVDTNKRSIDVRDGKIEVLQGQIDEFDIAEIEKRRVSKLTEQASIMTAAKQQLKPLKELQVVQQQQVELFKATLGKVPTALPDTIGNEQTLTQYKDELQLFNEDRSKVMAKLAQYQKNLLGVIQCPKCTHEWNPGQNIDVQQQRQMKDKATSILVAIDQDIVDVNSDIVGVNNIIAIVDAKMAERRKSIRAIELQISIKQSEIISTGRQIAFQQGVIDTANDMWHTVNNAKVQDPTSDLQKKIDVINQEKSLAIKTIEQYESLIFDKKQWTGNFIKFKTYLSNKTIGVIQAHCNEYLSRVGTDLSIKIEGYKVNQDKTIREDITTHVLRDGMVKGDIEQFSGGEEARIIVSMILTQQKLINMSCTNGGLDMCFLDEIIESVDSVGILGLVKALNSLGQTIIIVTHGTFNQTYPNVIKITKTNGSSTIT